MGKEQKLVRTGLEWVASKTQLYGLWPRLQLTNKDASLSIMFEAGLSKGKQTEYERKQF